MNWFTTEDLLKREGPFTHCVDYTVWYILAVALLCVGIFFLVKYKNQKTTKIVITVLWAIAVALDVAKLIVNICTGFSITWDMPLYICTLFLYAMPFAIWGKGLIKNMGCAYVCTIGLLGAILNYIVPSVTVSHSLFSFLGLHTTIYHTMLWATPIIMLCTGYYKFKFKDFGWAFLGFVILTIPVIIFNYIAATDYMYFREGGVPVIEDIAAKIGYATPIFMYVMYAIAMIAMQCIIMGITKLVEITRNSFNKKRETTNKTNTLEETKNENKNERNS